MTAKRLIAASIVTGTVATAMTANPAHAEGSAAYIALGLGVTSAPAAEDSLNGKTEFKTGHRALVALGYRIAPSFRAELEASRSKSGIDTIALPGVNSGNPQSASGSITSTALMLNGYYDFQTDLPFTPYVGAGVGQAKVSVNDSSAPGLSGTNDSDRATAWQVMVGGTYALSPRVDMVAGYRFFDTKDLAFTSKGGTNYTSDGARTHALEIGVHYKF